MTVSHIALIFKNLNSIFPILKIFNNYFYLSNFENLKNNKLIFSLIFSTFHGLSSMEQLSLTPT